MYLLWIIPVSYLISSLLYFNYLWTQNKRSIILGFNTLRIAALLHVVSLIVILVKGGPIAGGLERSLYFFALLITIVHIATYGKFKSSVIGAFIAPLSFLMTLPSIISPRGIIPFDPSLSNPWIIVHISLVFLGEALFTVAFIAGLLYIFQENRIKSKHVGEFLKKLPSLTSLDRINHICLLVGFPLITLGLALGLISAKQIWGNSWHWGQKETWSAVTWFLYAILIHGRLASGWRGRKAALGAIIGFGIIIFTLFVIGYISPGMHKF